MSVEPFLTITLEENPVYDILNIVVNFAVPTPLQSIFAVEELREWIEKAKKKGKRFGFIMDVREIGIVPVKTIMDLVNLLDSYSEVFIALLIGTSVYSHKNSVLDFLFGIVRQFYNTKKPLKFVYTLEDSYSFIQEQQNLWL
jgi:hypothetical protein